MINCHIDATSPRDLLIAHPNEGLDYLRLPRKVAVARGAGVPPHTRLRRASRETCVGSGGETGPHGRGPHRLCRWGPSGVQSKPPREQKPSGRDALTKS
jgi:hypothetical protein